MDLQQELDVDLTCPICREVFKDPIVLPCSHSFCQICIDQWWTTCEENQGNKCPVCQKRAPRREPIRNLALRNAVEAVERWKVSKKRLESEKEIEAEELCNIHSEKLRLFCLHDFEPACLVCRDSKAHEYHSFRPVAEAADGLRKKLEEDLKPLENKLDLLQKFEESCKLCLLHVKHQASQAKTIISDEFKSLHKFLLEEEEARLKAVREEEKQKTQTMKDKMAAVSRQIEALSQTIRATEEQLKASDVSFLHKYKSTVGEVQRCPLQEEPQLGPGALIDLDKHLGNLTFNIWSRMKTLAHFSPVILDPNTAHPEVIVSEDLTSFTLGEEQKLPPNPERVRMDVEMIRASVGFDSGSHSWDVDVGDCTDWELGVVTESAYYIQDWEEVEKDTGWWSVSFKDGEYKTFTAHKGEGAPLKVRARPYKIRLHLEWNKHKLTFYDADTNKLIHSFVQIHQQKLFPVFVSGSDEPVTILPKKALTVDKLFE